MTDEPRDANGHLIRELHGVSLKTIVEALVADYGFDELARRIPINCFALNPSVSSSLTFLRRTPWARTQVEQLYIETRIAEAEGRPRPRRR